MRATEAPSSGTSLTHVSFANQYNNAPTVVASIGAEMSYIYGNVTVCACNVTTSGFDVCVANMTTGARGPRVSWIAVP